MSKILSAFMSICVSAALLAPVSYAYLIDRVEAVVNSEIITKGDVDRAVRDAAIRRNVSGPDALARLREEALNSIIERKLILSDARRFNIVEVSDSEVDAALDSIKSGYESGDEFTAALAADEISVDELKEELRDQILAMKYVDRRVRFFVRVTLDDMKEYYQRNIESFGDRSFSDVHDEIHALLVEIKTNEKLDEYLKTLRDRSEITIVGEDGSQGPGYAR